MRNPVFAIALVVLVLVAVLFGRDLMLLFNPVDNTVSDAGSDQPATEEANGTLPPANPFTDKRSEKTDTSNPAQQALTASPPSDPTPDAEQRASDEFIAELNGDYPTLDMRMDEMNARRPDQSFNEDAVREALLQERMWQEHGQPSDELGLSVEEKHDGREFILFDRLRLETLVAGDEIEIPIQQANKTYRASITESHVNADGSVTWNGELFDELGAVKDQAGNPATLTLTSGDRMMSGGMFTPEGHFVIEAKHSQGWIASAHTLFKFNENEPDVVIPGELQGDDQATHTH